MKNNTSKQLIKSIRLPDSIWSILRKISDKNYRTLNSQLLKMIEDWLVDHDYMVNENRTKSE